MYGRARRGSIAPIWKILIFSWLNIYSIGKEFIEDG